MTVSAGMHRRQFLVGLVTAPAIVRASSLMPVRSPWLTLDEFYYENLHYNPNYYWWTVDGWSNPSLVRGHEYILSEATKNEAGKLLAKGIKFGGNWLYKPVWSNIKGRPNPVEYMKRFKEPRLLGS